MAVTYSRGNYGAGLYSADNLAADTAIFAWSYSVDGHQFMILRLGAEGTYALDVGNGKWFHWAEEGNVGIETTEGVLYDEFALMGGKVDNFIYTFDPEELDDHSGQFETSVVGGIQSIGKKSSPCYAVAVSGNVSDETNNRYVKLTISDDGGVTWREVGSNYPTGATDTIRWRSLGRIKYPGRLFSVKSNGALLSIDDISMDEPDV